MKEQIATGRHTSSSTGIEFTYTCTWVATGIATEWRAVIRTVDGRHVAECSGFEAKGGIDAEMQRQIEALP